MVTAECIYIDEFEMSTALFDVVDILVVVKSQDQIERRQRMLGQLARGRIGRIEPRPIAEGLLVKCKFPPNVGSPINSENAEWIIQFPEPRHIVPYSKNQYLLTEIGRVNLINAQGRVLDVFVHPYFAFLHTVVLNQSRDRILVASPGYDAILELDMRTKEETWRWFGWDHGFNPNDEAIYFTNTKEKEDQLKKNGYIAKYIDPNEYNEQGLLTTARTTHPNVARYNPYKSEETIIASLGTGKIIEINRNTSDYVVVLDTLAPMPHGIMPYDQGWMVTNTCKGEFWILDKAFNILRKYIFRRLPGKPEYIGPSEWLQLVIPIPNGKFLGLDANRGIIICDPERRCYEICHVNPNWCLQDILVFADLSND